MFAPYINKTTPVLSPLPPPSHQHIKCRCIINGPKVSEQPQQQSLYEILGVSPFASSGEVFARFEELAQLYSPGSSFYIEIVPEDEVGEGDQAQFQLIKEVFRKLSDPEQRAAYDQSIGISQASRGWENSTGFSLADADALIARYESMGAETETQPNPLTPEPLTSLGLIPSDAAARYHKLNLKFLLPLMLVGAFLALATLWLIKPEPRSTPPIQDHW